MNKTSLTAVWTPKAFEADPAHALNPPVAGNVWYQVAGPLLASRWNKLNTGVLVDKIFFKCTAVFCTLPDEFASCEDVSLNEFTRFTTLLNQGHFVFEMFRTYQYVNISVY